ncbi:MAG: FAD:protein FMN transferase [Ruminococcaceae bacterium]|nr:FAD:protein FMN transferase [Oscillospiraceae bacterium]
MKKIFSFFLALTVLFCAGCAKNVEYKSSDFFAMNTYATITADCTEDILSRAKSLVFDIENQLSATIAESDINNLSNTERETYDETISLLSYAKEISDATDGAFDFTLGTLVRLWNITGDAPTLPQKDEIEEALSHCGFEKTNLSDGKFSCDDKKLSVDLGGIAKGYAGQKVAEFLKEKGVCDASVYLGGNVTVIGSSPSNRKKGVLGWNVAINNPFDTADILGVVTLCDKTVSVSGSYERYFELDGEIYHHILDSKTGYPARSDLASVAVIAADGTLADGLSTAFFVMGLEKSVDFYKSGIFDFEAIFCTNDRKVFVTDGLQKSFTPNFDAKSSDQLSILFPDYR